jgi:hypothetical protein
MAIQGNLKEGGDAKNVNIKWKFGSE